MFYRKELKNGVKVHLDLTKARLYLIYGSQHVNSLFNVGFICADINCQLKIHFSNNIQSFFFDSMYDLISKTEGFLNDI